MKGVRRRVAGEKRAPSECWLADPSLIVEGDIARKSWPMPPIMLSFGACVGVVSVVRLRLLRYFSAIKLTPGARLLFEVGWKIFLRV